MDCKNMAAKLQEALDGILPPEEESAVRSHLQACPSCSRFSRALALAGRTVAALPLYEPSPAFRAAVLDRLAARRRAAAWLAWASAPALALASSGLAAAGLLLARVLSLDGLLAGWQLLREPGRAAALLKLEAARSALFAWQLCGEAASWLPSSGPGLSAAFPLQLAAGMLLAGVIVVFAARGVPRPALSTHWRSL
jgi:predicted anti-sigma-YlaC factor YlaD